MDNNTNDNTPALALVTNIADARKAKQTNQVEESPLEAFGPVSILIQGDDWQITACDGEQSYMWLARKKSKRSKGYTVTEVYPGLTKKRTALRDVKEPIDLEMQHTNPLATMSDVLEDLAEIIFERFVEDDAEMENT